MRPTRDESSRPRRGIGGRDGYVLLAVVMILVVMGILLGAAVPVWQHVMQREREEELIWRAKQVVQAIELYQKKHPGGYPPNLKILVEQKFLRKLYKDPMSKDGEWKVLRQLSPEIRTAGLPGQRSKGSRAGERQGQKGSRRRSSQRSTRSGFGPSGSEQALGGIVGVVSKSEEESIRVLNGKSHYNEWLFVYLQATRGRRRPGRPGPSPGARQPQGPRPPTLPGERRRPPSKR